MSSESVFFGPYGEQALTALLSPCLTEAFEDGALPKTVMEYGIRQAAIHWGDARKALTLFRNAGDRANQHGRSKVTESDIDTCIDTTNKETTIEKLTTLPKNHLSVLVGIIGWEDQGTTAIKQPVSTTEITEILEGMTGIELGERAVRQIITDLETMGLVETWIESRGRNGRVKQHETTFDPHWVHETVSRLVNED